MDVLVLLYSTIGSKHSDLWRGTNIGGNAGGGSAGGVTAAISRLSQADLRLSVPSGGVDTQHVPDIWEQPTPPPPPAPPRPPGNCLSLPTAVSDC